MFFFCHCIALYHVFVNDDAVAMDFFGSLVSNKVVLISFFAVAKAIEMNQLQNFDILNILQEVR